MRILILLLLLGLGLNPGFGPGPGWPGAVREAKAAPPQDTRTAHPVAGHVSGVRWGSEPYEPATPKPNYQQKLKRASSHDPDSWRAKRTNRRDNSDNSPHK